MCHTKKETMVTALTGTPGTGKTTTAEHLRKEGLEVLDLNGFIDKKGLKREEDKLRDTFNVDIQEMKELYKNEAPSHDIVEGHLSHLLDIDMVVVLRCSPEELKKRMERKDWHKEKKEENIEAEVLDIILMESLERCETVFEIDTTDMDPEQVKDSVFDILNGKTEGYEAGKVDWSEDYFLKE